MRPFAHGKDAVVLDLGELVLRIEYGTLAARPPIPEVVQPITSTQIGKIGFECLPRLETRKGTQEELDLLARQVWDRGYELFDAGIIDNSFHNVGRDRSGQLLVLDPGCLRPRTT